MASKPTKSLAREMHVRTNPGTCLGACDNPGPVACASDSEPSRVRQRGARGKLGTTLTTSEQQTRVKDTVPHARPEPLIPERNMYVYKPSPITNALHNIQGYKARKTQDPEASTERAPETRYAVDKLVHALCTAAVRSKWNDVCENALTDHLPIREHHKALLSHKLYVTMVGALVARALEQATFHTKNPLDLLADRYYIRSITSHDSSKTSKVEAAAYSGIIAVHMDQKKAQGRYRTGWTPSDVCDTDDVLRRFANIGFVHHYENNPHHPEHYKGKQMDDIALVEAIVDGLACIFERNKQHSDVKSWLAMYTITRFKDQNAALAESIMLALGTYITDVDYKVLQTFRESISLLIGESDPWSRICCDPSRVKDINPPSVPRKDFTSCFQ